VEVFEITAGASSIVPAAPDHLPFFMGEAGAAPATAPAEPTLMFKKSSYRDEEE
jgi:hypothetical protein